MDWVYRPNVIGIDAEGGPSNFGPFGGWGAGNIIWDVGRGIGEAGIICLYDSMSYMRQAVGTSVVAAGFTNLVLPDAARIESRRLPSVHMVEGSWWYRPTSWAASDRAMGKIRLGWYEQDPVTGLILLDQDWDIFDIPAGLQDDNPSLWANDYRGNIHEWTFQHYRGQDSTPNFRVPIFWKGRRTAPNEHHALWMIIQQPSGNFWSTTSLRGTAQVRCLMSGQDD